MPRDEGLTERIRAALGDEKTEEKRMFGGVGFLLDGHLALAASGQGGLLVRVDPAETTALLGQPGASSMQMRGRDVAGWMRVDTDALTNAADLERWVQTGVDRARSLASE